MDNTPEVLERVRLLAGDFESASIKLQIGVPVTGEAAHQAAKDLRHLLALISEARTVLEDEPGMFSSAVKYLRAARAFYDKLGGDET